ncbi:IS630 family transposase [Methanolobus psychrotolerans]|uniref:IS630 family transposase n=1 Tax=Methanolobus psychrotolerans TaxID=1874706 RepID=UPI001F5D3C4A|nr:IS630 family transposase [Methanolobus psychrotolerans]
MDDNCVVGFLDESSPQTTSNTVRLWSFNKPVMFKNTTKLKANSFGFYSLNGNSVIDFKEHSTKEDVCSFLSTIKNSNMGKRIVIILDNFRSHRAKDTVDFSLENNIELVYLPPYSPDLNPIEFIWKSVKRIISCNFIKDLDHMKKMIAETFISCSSNLGFARKWIEKFLDNKLEKLSN